MEKNDVQAEDCPDCRVPMDLAYRSESVTAFAPSQMLNRSQQAGSYLLYCFDNIMNLSRIEAGDLELFREPLRLEAVIEEVVMLFLEKSQYRDRSLRMEVLTDSVTVDCDSERMREVLAHLVDNALRFSEVGTEVVVRLEKGDETKVRVSVLDYGIGIAPESYGSIFESFQQADSSHTRDFDGLGLGLTLASGLLRLHGIELQFESQVARGTRFFFDVPTQA